MLIAVSYTESDSESGSDSDSGSESRASSGGTTEGPDSRVSDSDVLSPPPEKASSSSERESSGNLCNFQTINSFIYYVL